MKQLLLPFEQTPTFDAKDFIVSRSNEEAYLWLQEWPHWPSPCMAIYGESGCGKTHLSSIWQTITQAQYLKAEDFNAASLDILFNGPGFFVLDDAHLINREEKLFHFYNHIISIRGNLLFLSPIAPAHWEMDLPDLRSRLNAMPAIKISPPDEALLIQVIHKLFTDLQLKVDEVAIHYLTKHMERSFESARSWTTALNTFALTHKRGITIPVVKEILSQIHLAEKRL